MSNKLHSFTLRGLLLMAWALLLSSAVYAQQVTGTVASSSSGEPLAGATVLIKGTTQGVFTDEDGKFSIKAADDDVLQVSYIGYVRKEIPVNGQSTIDVSLDPSEKTLEEVVVTGYGTQRAREVTSSITSVKAEDFNQGQVNDPTQLIQGKVAGLSIQRPGGDPNGGFTLRLRGLSTLGANTEPLIIIDGVVGASLQTIDPNDIQSIDVLKDGSAAAIYGSRASSGVIIITTKKGVTGETSFNYNGFATYEQVARGVQVADRGRWLELRERTVDIQAGLADDPPTPAEIQATKASLDRGGNTNWLDEVTAPSLSQVHNLSLAGGFGGLTYRASINYRDIDGVGYYQDDDNGNSRRTGFNQLNGRLNLTQKAFGDRLTVSVNLAATDRRSRFGFSEAFRYATTFAPAAPVLADPAESPIIADRYAGFNQIENFDYFNPVAIQQQTLNEGRLKRLLLSGRAEFEIVRGLKAAAFYSIQQESDLFGQYYDKASYFRGIGKNGYLERFAEDRTNQQLDLTSTYDQSFGNTDLEILGGYSYQQFDNQSFGLQAGNIISDQTSFYNPFFATDPTNLSSVPGRTGGRQEYRVIAFFGRARLNIDDTYFLMASYRREGASRLGENNKWGDFPALSAGVNLANLVDIPAVNEFKLRAGYGVTGNIPPASNLTRILYAQSNFFFFNGDYVPAYGPVRNPNPDLKWEQKGEFDVGFDFSLLDYRLTGSFDYYNRVTRDFIFETVVPVPPNFAPRTWVNLEDVVLRNQGYEASVGYRFGNNDLYYEPRVIFSTFQTVLDTLDVEDPQFTFFSEGENPFFEDPLTVAGAPGLNDNPIQRIFPGQEIGQFYGFEVDENNPINEEGRWNYVDQDGDGDIDDDDRTVIGNGLPDFTLNFQNTFRFGNLDLSFFIRGVFGHDLANLYRVFYEPLNSRLVDNVVETDLFLEDLVETPFFNSYYVEDADYVALDNFSIGYNFNVNDRSGFSKIRVYVSGQNLAYLTNYTGVDPSVRYNDPGSADNGGRPAREFNASPLSPGIDRRNTYFRTRSFTAGVNLNF